MKACRAVLIIVALLVIALPAVAEENRSGAGIALTSSSIDVDVPGVENIDFGGVTLFWKYGFNDHWGLLLSYRTMTDRETLPPGEEIESRQFGVHGVYMWRHGKRVRPHLKFGVANTDLRFKDYLDTQSVDDLAFSVGGGLEAGSERVAFYADYDFTQVEFFGFDFDVASLALGIVFKY